MSLEDKTVNGIRTLTWKSLKGNICKLHIFSKTKEFKFEINDYCHNLNSKDFIDAIIGIVNIHMRSLKTDHQQTTEKNNVGKLYDMMQDRQKTKFGEFINELGKNLKGKI